MVVDMLEGFTRKGPLATPRADALVPEQVQFLSALPAGSRVVFLADAHQPDDLEFMRFPVHCLRETPEAEIRSELLAAAEKAAAKIHIIRKRTFSGFLGTELDTLVAAQPDKAWVVIGCVTDCCVETNVAELVLRGCSVTVVRDLIDTWDLPAEQAAVPGLPPTQRHDAGEINSYWFEHRFPAIWGARVVSNWRDLLETGA